MVAPHNHSVVAQDSKVAQELVSHGGRLVQVYGDRQLIALSDPLPELLSKEGIEVRDDYHFVMLNTGFLDVRLPEIRAKRSVPGNPIGKQLHLVHFAGPILPAWRRALLDTGVRVVTYVPQNTYLVYGDATAVSRLGQLTQSVSFIDWVGAFGAEFKCHPKTVGLLASRDMRTVGGYEFGVQMVSDGEANDATLLLLERVTPGGIIKKQRRGEYLDIIVRLPGSALAPLAARPDVISILPHFPAGKRGERQDMIITGGLSGSGPSAPGYLAWLADKGFTQRQFDDSGVVVDVSDSGIDNGTLAPGHFALYPLGDVTQPSRVRYNRLIGTANGQLFDAPCEVTDTNAGPVSTIAGIDGHGTLSAHIIAGYSDLRGFPHADAVGYRYGLGVCPFVRVGSSVIFDPAQFTHPDYQSLLSQAYNDGARISNNSWSMSNMGLYDQDAQTYDALVRDVGGASTNRPMIVVFAAGNQGPDAQSIESPATAKNVITVGAAEGVESLSLEAGGNNRAGSDGQGHTDAIANDANDVPPFSARGPCADGRTKPDLVAPGTHITGGAPQASPPSAVDGPGDGLACFDATGISALLGSGGIGNTNNYFPLQQEFYTVSSGTSQAAPAVSGACALVWQYFLNQGWGTPSPAMAKAYLMNSTRFLARTNADDSLWSPVQGMGEMNLGTAFDGLPRVLRDQVVSDQFTAAGQSWTYIGNISRSNRSVRVTLAWTDAPGSTIGAALNNDLDLTVTVGSRVYKGNVFNG
ncbi:MAG TPA: S8 family serine peptidase, partial [Candidatus Limnocylindria bacterium]|nr:S8 family serine peptidase [Candidatus Limnocylindria bacterium]